MTASVPISDSGTAAEGMMVARKLRRKRKITRITRPIVSANSYSTSATDARTVLLRSVNTRTFTEAGKLASSWGSNFSMASTTLIVLAPG